MRRDLVVPKGKCPLEVLAEQGERISNTWIFLHASVVSNLKNSDGVIPCCLTAERSRLKWKATEEYPEITILFYDFEGTGWYLLTDVDAEDIAFSDITSVEEPEEVIFIKMEGAE